MTEKDLFAAIVIGPFACLTLIGLYVQGKGWQIYRRIGDYSIGLVTFFIQLEYRGCNFPGRNVLEAQIATQPADLQAQVQVLRRRMRYLRWGVLLYVGFFVVVLFLVRILSS